VGNAVNDLMASNLYFEFVVLQQAELIHAFSFQSEKLKKKLHQKSKKFTAKVAKAFHQGHKYLIYKYLTWCSLFQLCALCGKKVLMI
jgi:hypothetical protein